MKTKTQNLKLIFLLLGVFFSLPSIAVEYGDSLQVTTQGQVLNATEFMHHEGAGTPDIITRVKVKNGVEFYVQLPINHQVFGITNGVLIGDQIKVSNAGTLRFEFNYNGTWYYVRSHVNYYGVLQYQGGDAPSEIIVTGEEDLEKEVYLPDGKFPGLRWFNGYGQSLENIIPDGTTRVSLKKLKETGFTHFKVRLRDGTSNQLGHSGIGGGESWIEFKVIFLPSCYTVSLSAQPDEGGSVQGAGTFNENSQVTVSATPNNGYKFVKWTENGVQVSTSASYQFTLTKDRNLVALFEELPKLVVDPTSISASAEGKEATVTVTSNQNWKRNFQ